MPDPPRKGTNARKVLDCISESKDGLTAFEVERNLGAIKNLDLRIHELSSKGFIETLNKREVEGVRSEVWTVRRPKEQVNRRKGRLGRPPKQELEKYECPACGASIHHLLVNEEFGGKCVEVNPQRRIIVFAGPYETIEWYDHETGEVFTDRVPKDAISMFEEHTGKLVIGRPATEDEREEFTEYKRLRKKPWTIGFEGHLSTCKKWDRWFNSKADEKRRTWDTKWDPIKKRYGFKRFEDEKKSMMEELAIDDPPPG